MASNITIDTDRTALRPDFLDVMHTVRLSRRRAQSIGNHLASAGATSTRIVTEGFGQQYPVAPNDTVEGRSPNRDVDLRLSRLTAS